MRLVTLFGAVVLALSLVISLLPARQSQARSFLWGVINNRGLHYDDEWARGVRATTLELQWRRYEPQEGVYDLAYIRSMQQRLSMLKRQGWYVQLIPGYQYVPDWVFSNYPDMHFVNQYGEPYTPERSSFRVINAPFNPQARQLIGGYIQRIFQDFAAADFDSVRIGGGPQGELRYPPPAWNGHANSYWAFDRHAQNPLESGIPAAARGWRPGLDANPGSVDRQQLIVNRGFEQRHPLFGILGWSPDDQVIAELTQERPYSGALALRLSVADGGRAHQYVPVEPGASYAGGGRLRSPTGAGRARIFFSQYDAAMQPVPGAPYLKLETGSQEWAPLAGNLALDPLTAYVKVELDGSQAGVYDFDDLQLVREGDLPLLDRDIDVPLSFYEWYARTLTDYQNWQIAEFRRYYGGRLDLIYAGKGIRANAVTDALTNDLRGSGWSEQSSALYAATVYEWHLDGLPSREALAVYLTGIDEPPAAAVDDRSPYPGRWSAARWLAFLAHSRDMEIWGENSGQDSAATLQLTARRAWDNGFLGLLWGFEAELYADPDAGFATIADYEALIASRRHLFMPLIER